MRKCKHAFMLFAVITAAAIPLLLVPSLLCAQNRPAAPTTTIRARTELVTVPVVVTREGQHVPGMNKEDFTVFEDGKQKDIAFFEEVKAEQQPLQVVRAPNGAYTNEIIGNIRPAGVLVILLDTLNTPFLEQGNGRKQLIKFLSRSLPPGQTTMLLQLRRSGLRVLHDFTTSPDVLIAAVKRVESSMDSAGVGAADVGEIRELKGKDDVGNIAPDVAQEASVIQSALTDDLKTVINMQDCQRTEVTVAAFEQLARALGALRGRKTLLWATGGQLMFPLEEPPSQCRSLFDKYEQMWHQLSSGDIAVYPIDLVQPRVAGYVGPQFGSAVRVESYSGKQPMFESFAQYTGGIVCTFRNDLDTCFKNAVDDSAAYYLLSYYARPLEKPGWRKLQVKTRASGVHLRTRSGYFSLGMGDSPEERRKIDVALAVVSPLEYTALPFTAKWTNVVGPPDQRKYSFELLIKGLSVDRDDGNHVKVDIIARAQDAAGKAVGDVTQNIEARLTADNLQKVLTGGMRYHSALALPQGEYKVRFIVRDALTGRIGTVTAALKTQP